MKVLYLKIKNKDLRYLAQAIFTPPFRDGIILQYNYSGEDPVGDAKRTLERWYATASLGVERIIIIELARALGDGEATVKVVTHD